MDIQYAKLISKIISQTAFECKCCKKQHSVPNEGFTTSKFIQNLLTIKSNSIDSNQVFEEINHKIRSANKTVDEIDKMAQESESYIYDYFEDIERQVDLRREH